MTQTSPAHARRRRLESFALLALLLVLLGLLFDWNWLKGPIERRVRAITGREFSIDGNLAGGIGRRLTLRADEVRLGNAAWSSQPQMAHSAQLELQLEWWPLLRGDLDVVSVRADKLDALFERNAAGEANWQFHNTRVHAPHIEQLAIAEGKVHFVDPLTRTDVHLDVHTEAPKTAGTLAPLVTSGKGRYRGADFELASRSDSPLELRFSDRPYRLDFRARAGGTRAHASGELLTPMQISGYDLRFELSGSNMSTLYPLLGLALPDTPPYSLDGRLRHEGSVWNFHDFHGKVGSSDLNGDSRVDTGGERIFLTADLSSQRLDLADLAGFVGGDPGRKAPASEKAPAAASAPHKERLFPDTPYDLVKLRSMDADVTLRAAHVESPPLPLDAMSARLHVVDGLVNLDPIQFDAAGGQIAGRVTFDGRRNPLASSTKIHMRQLELPKIFPKAVFAKGSAGRISADIALDGNGNSVAKILAGADGSVGLAMGEGRISNLLMELAGLNLAESLRYMIKDRVVPIRCAYADFAVKDGLMTVSSLAFDTSETVIYGEGTVSLSEESLDMRLYPQPKDKSLLVLRSPLRVSGTLLAPKVGPEKGAIAKRAAATLALYALAPPAALLALIEPGPGKDAACRAP